jgi:hypothetical protein
LPVALSEQERTAAQADLDRLTGELVRLYQLREQLKLALSDGEGEGAASSSGEVVSDADLLADPPGLRLVQGALENDPQRDPAEREALRAEFQVIQGGLS